MNSSRGRIVRSSIALLVVALAGAACGHGAGKTGSASNYPSHPITWIVPYDPGGGSDAQVRRLQPYLQKTLGQKINIVYKPGGGGAAGWVQLHSAKPDGYTLGNVIDPNLVQVAASGSAGFKATDFRYITWTETSPGALVVGKNSRFKTLQEFVKAAKAAPGKVTVAGTGNTAKGDVQAIAKATGTKLTYVPVSGGVGSIVTDLQGGHVDAATFGADHVVEHADTLRGLGVAGSTPSTALPGVPTFQSLGYKGFDDVDTWGIIAPPGTPDAIVQKLNKAVVQAVKEPKVQEQMKKSGLTPLTMTPEQAKKKLQEDIREIESQSSGG